MASAQKSNPKLWDKIKHEFMESDKGGERGQWSARKAQLAVQEYKKRGGGYEDEGPSQKNTDLHRWTDEDWGTKSGDKSNQSGQRYLPKRVRMLLTEDEYNRSTQKKKDGKQQFVDQPDDIKEKVSYIKANGPSKEMLMERAQDLEIVGRSKMDKESLLAAIEDATDKNGRGKETAAGLEQKTKEELYEMAQHNHIDGRSNMSKEDLINALAK